MRQERRGIAMGIAEQLWEAERTSDIAMANTARLLANALDARMKLKVAACVGQGVVEALSATIDRQTASRRSLLVAHDALNEIKGFAIRSDTIRSDEDYGGGGDKKVPAYMADEPAPLRRVA